MSEKQTQEEVCCPKGHSDHIRLRGVRNLWDHGFEMGRADALSNLRGKVLTYWCEDCQDEFTVKKSVK